ncbi:MAG: hypothetical protein RI897_1886 [Verrucomicrobiota bacterium]
MGMVGSGFEGADSLAEGFDIFEFGACGEAVAEVGDIAGGIAHGFQHMSGCTGNDLWGGEHEGGVEVTLEHLMCGEGLAELGEVHAPIDAESAEV